MFAGLARGLVKKAVAASVAAGAALVAVLAFGATVFYALQMIVPPLAAAAITFLLFAVAALIVVLVFLVRDSAAAEEDEDEPAGLGQRAYMLFRQRPILGTVAALAGGWIFLRNPALATMVAAAFTETSHGRRRR
jgi:membrane protein implicated in regulation of membrane protease activity